MHYYILGRGVKCEESQIFRNMQIVSISLFPQSLYLSFCSIILLKSLEAKSPVNYNLSNFLSQGMYLSQGICLLSIFLDDLFFFLASMMMPLKVFCCSSSFPCSLNISTLNSKISPFPFHTVRNDEHTVWTKSHMSITDIAN